MGFIVITTLLNILSVKVADKANYVLMALQLLVLVFEDLASAASSIALQIGGQLFGAVFLAGLVVACPRRSSAGSARSSTPRWRTWWSPGLWA